MLQPLIDCCPEDRHLIHADLLHFNVDFRREVMHHYASIGLRVPRIEERLRCYQVHIGLGALAWNAFQENGAELERTAQRTLAVATPAHVLS